MSAYDRYLSQLELDDESNLDKWDEFCMTMPCTECKHCGTADNKYGQGVYVCCAQDPFLVDEDGTCPDYWSRVSWDKDDYYYTDSIPLRDTVWPPSPMPGFGEYNLMDELERLNIR